MHWKSSSALSSSKTCLPCLTDLKEGHGLGSHLNQDFLFSVEANMIRIYSIYVQF